MIDALISFTELQRSGHGRDARAVRALCARYAVPVIKLNQRQYALKASDYELLLSRATQGVK